MFQRPHISPVAEFALSLLIFREGQERKTRELDEVRLALLSRGLSGAAVFPEHFGEFDGITGVLIDDGSEESEKAINKAKRTGDVEYDYSGVDWAAPSQDPDEMDELMRLQQAIFGAQAISLTDED